MAFTTKAFDLFYKRYPTGTFGGVSGNLQEYWYTASILTGGVRVSHSFLNYPTDPSGATYITSRESESLDNKFHRAIPWGSQATDMLWNCTVPSWSFTIGAYNDDEFGSWPSDTYSASFWSVDTYTSKSFHSQYYPGGRTLGVGVSGNYSVTSSWRVLDLKYLQSGDTFTYVTWRQGTGSLFPTYISSTPLSTTEPTAPLYAYRITYPLINQYSSSSIDGQYFDQAGGAFISRGLVSASMAAVSTSYNDNTPTGLSNVTTALKQRRLFFPTPYSGSGTTNGTDYWFKLFTGYRADEIFDENGGIYNVELTLKRFTKVSGFGLSPSTGSHLNIFIHNVVTNAPSSSQRIPGADGWYPPSNNIVRIDQGTVPSMSFYDIQTGFSVEKFNFNLVQYGHPAQFCIEPSGSLENGEYFGIIVDDISICKVGVTTDPSLIKPVSIGQTTQTNRRQNLGIDTPAAPEDLPTE